MTEFIKGFIKLRDQICELNYKGTKIEIGVKLGDQKYNFTYKKWSLYREPLIRWHVTLTRGSQRLRLTVNVQIGLSGSILHGFIKLGDQICELNYKGTKSEIRNKLRDQKCNFSVLNKIKTRKCTLFMLEWMHCLQLHNKIKLLSTHVYFIWIGFTILYWKIMHTLLNSR